MEPSFQEYWPPWLCYDEQALFLGQGLSAGLGFHAVLLQMLLNKGTYNGHKILAPPYCVEMDAQWLARYSCSMVPIILDWALKLLQSKGALEPRNGGLVWMGRMFRHHLLGGDLKKILYALLWRNKALIAIVWTFSQKIEALPGKQVLGEIGWWKSRVFRV